MYDYAPTPKGIHAAVEEALGRQRELVRPGEAELAWVQARRKLPEDERQLHSLLMAEGDLAAGELEIPVEWLEKLASEGRALYLEQGLWIAAEQREEYETALAEPESGHASDIVRRMLRYRGGAYARQVAARYGWPEEDAKQVLEGLCQRGEAVGWEEVPGIARAGACGEAVVKEAANQEKPEKTGGSGEDRAAAESRGREIIYYHAQLYQKARVRTLKNRREEAVTCPPESYAALLFSRIQRSAPPEECLREAAASLAGTALPAAAWEEWVFPARVKNYRESMLDTLLAGGEYFWHMEENGRLRFDWSEEIDWDGEREIPWEILSDQERILAEMLKRRGASFMQALNGALGGESPHEALLSLVEKGVVYADSYVPVRQWMNREKMRKAAVRQRVGARVKALQAGRYDLVRPLRALTAQEQMDRCFDRYLILCRETAAAWGMSWQEALNLLRVQEYTGQVRRGYFVKGLSGAQFIRRKDFESVTALLRQPRQEAVWLNAADPMQPWGKLLPHEESRSFANVPGTVAVFREGRPEALFERQGRVLRVFEPERLQENLWLFAEEFRRGRILPGRKRVVVKEYPEEAAQALERSGFLREMQDYVLYR